MIQTIIFRVHPSASQENQLHEIFTIYNRVRRFGYKLLFQLKDTDYNEEEKRKIIQPQLMQICHNNPYVNTILIDNETKLAQQQTWLKKRKRFMINQIDTISNKIEKIKQKSNHDSRLKGLYSRLSSIQNKLIALKLKPVVFGTKNLFRERILTKISCQEFKIGRDSSFGCVGKVQGVNLNIKMLENRTIRIHTFRKEKNKKWLIIPFSVNQKQDFWYQEILKAKKYSATIKRKLFKGEIRYFTHISYEVPEPETIHRFKNGAIGLDLNYNFVSLSNVDKQGNFKSYHEISFRNLHTYRKGRRINYINYKMDKILNYCLNKRKGLVIENLKFNQKFT